MNTDISTIKLWFERAVPNPTDKNRAVQLGVHFEEVGEMGDAIREDVASDVCEFMAKHFKAHVGIPIADPKIDRKELLDALCDQIVTAVGVAHMFGMDIAGALSEVNRSNWSKMDEHGQPTFDENGKIKKGVNYTPPNLEGFL